MNEVIAALKHKLSQLETLLRALDNDLYCTSVPVLSNRSIGQHTRHILEFLLALDTGYKHGAVNYNARKRDRRIETDKTHALHVLKATEQNLRRKNKDLRLEVSQSVGKMVPFFVGSNFERELVFNLDHVIHHMALIRISVEAVSTIVLDEEFGVAASTIQHRNSSHAGLIEVNQNIGSLRY